MADVDMTLDRRSPSASKSRKQKGRGLKEGGRETDGRYSGQAGVFERLEEQNGATSTRRESEKSKGAAPARSVEGWIIVVRNLHEEAQEEDIHENFESFGQIKNLHLNLDRRTGFVKGYAFIEFETFEEAEAAIRGMDNQQLLGQTVYVDWAFSKAPNEKRRR
ncbi:RNA-binding protein 8A family protein [Toxoplasma gondii GAB2-2007-GAL-DOM2]|uniref:RNA-binding protein 8A family protein n=5 Tax=Toxoplasma gondii TaxID=5811 RepID=S7V3Q8_TOXGG|nr:RNA-binding protein 8A family protein [Toxoplasma gondii GT1]KAF4641910.1 RNA-binding protein 8A family protein [Toxoplasma gondii]KFG48845.1 RNA-binding protein 8A family protein [Toxoplasma gondii GAB2-2007-GAL-DOM2]KFG55218.1 RNA-binding protein 8A family protein [Toxoplasma gondii FOU]PUA92556.1 RNA-binding protein 8A family protein [Toxoplasma gondii TgCATBr9]